jgi:hypothetical protein
MKWSKFLMFVTIVVSVHGKVMQVRFSFETGLTDKFILLIHTDMMCGLIQQQTIAQLTIFLKFIEFFSYSNKGTFTCMLQSNLKVAKKSISTNGILASCSISNL